MEKRYDLYIILNDVPIKVQLEDNGTATEEEAIDFVKTMSKTDYVDFISTEEGILSFTVKNIKSVFYLAKPV